MLNTCGDLLAEPSVIQQRKAEVPESLGALDSFIASGGC
jgi:hypothetical protein